ncbi:MAG: phosphatidate cytidylyltransferase [Chloroflexi bacterium]|nr:phosphatidate cytidylyltransferase [Chloroflexota bacterium]
MGIPLILAVIYFGGVLYAGAVAVALGIAALEFQHMRHPWLAPVAVLSAVIVAGIAVGARGGRGIWLAWLAGALVVAPLAALAQAEDDARREDVVWTLAAVTYAGFLGGFLVLLRDADNGRSWVFLAVLATFATDTAAYFTGRAIGKRPLAPAISPKKTFEGFVGGCIGGAIAVVALHAVFNLGTTPGQVALLALTLPIAAAAGDLVESAIKRIAGVKDASELIPGHGGVMDRLDSVLFVAPLVYLFVIWSAG